MSRPPSKSLLDNDILVNYILNRKYEEDTMKECIKVMKALFDPNRVKLVKMLQQKAICVCEMQAALEISQPAVSKQLKILEGGGLVQCRKEGLWVNFSLTDGSRNPYAASLLGNLRHWFAVDPDIRALIERSKSLRTENIYSISG